MKVSVVIPAFNAEATLSDCLRAVKAQAFPSDEYEVIVVDDGSTDDTARIASAFGCRVISQENRGAPSARNRGLAAAAATWVAFTDADCIPSRSWLRWLVPASEDDAVDAVAGRTLGYESRSPAARYVDLSGGLDAQRHLDHPVFPFAPSGNVLYRRSTLERVGGFEARYSTYDACDLHLRLRQAGADRVRFEPRALVLHRHRVGWSGYYRQQRGYGYGLGQFTWRHRDKVSWSFRREAAQWSKIALYGAQVLWPGRADAVLCRRGRFVKALAQRIGFDQAYYSARERSRWENGACGG
ncbi:glycosyltransferase [Pseudazoarcus pumilus]|uniref:glycosyltransferase n=1 Tax=Pseudazoarcus pumilus TaxID=2067960 RepID=UPI0013DA6074|nr:glycosyltransferase [Pseudazoarcus pumilus]